VLAVLAVVAAEEAVAVAVAQEPEEASGQTHLRVAISSAIRGRGL